MKLVFKRRGASGWRWLASTLFNGRRHTARRPARSRRSSAGLEALETRLALASGAALVRDINAVIIGANPASFAVAGDVAYFAAGDAEHGRELWRTDGTAAGTTLVADIEPGLVGSDPQDLTVVGSKVFFSASKGNDRELWVTDGTAAGATLVKDIRTLPSMWASTSSYPGDLTAVGDKLFFSADDGVHGNELWVSDGTEAGTRMVKDTDPRFFNFNFDFSPASGAPQDLTEFQGRLFFVAMTSEIDGTQNGRVLWSSDGTEEGTFIVSSLGPPDVYGNYRGEPTGLTVSGNLLYFAASTATTSRELWTSDGTFWGTEPLATVNENTIDQFGAIHDIVPFGTGVLFTADDGTGDQEPWVSDGTSTGTGRLADLRSDGASDPTEYTVVGGTAYFSADDGVHGRELWATDGTAVGTRLVRDVNPGAAGSLPRNLVALGGQVGFAADDGTHGREPWSTDGSEGGTTLVKDINPAGDSIHGSASFGAVARLNGRLLFGADDGDGTQLWASDVTGAGTARVATIEQATGDAFEAGTSDSAAYVAKAVLDGFLFFPADDGVHGPELWKSDGTAAGTTRLTDLPPAAAWTRFQYVGVAGTRVIFATAEAWDHDLHEPIPGQVYSTDGTAAGAILLATGSFTNFANVGDSLFALRQDGVILRTDGTEAGTAEIDDATQSDDGFYRTIGFLGVGDRLYYEKATQSTVDGVTTEFHSVWTADAAGNVAELVSPADYGSVWDWRWGVPFDTAASGPDGVLLVHYEYDEALGWRNMIWRLDASGNLARFSDLPVGWDFGPGKAVAVGGKVFYTGLNGAALELRVSNGTLDGTAVIASIGQSDDSSNVWVDSMRPFGQGIVFIRRVWVGDDQTRSLWYSDGTTGGTRGLVDDIDSIEGIVDGRIAYRKHGDDGVVRLVLTDGTSDGNEEVPAASSRPDSDPRLLADLGKNLLFTAADVLHGRELFASSLVTSTVPGQPTGVTAARGNAQATVSWEAPSSDGGAAVSDYVLERSADGGTTWQSVSDGVSTSTTATVTGLTNGTSYRFRVAAVNSVGTGAWSDPSVAVTPTGVPGAATGVVATPGDGRVSLAWTAPASDGGRAISDYVLEQSSDGGKSWKTIVDGVSAARSATVTGLVNGTSYVFRVSAVNALGTGPASAPSAAAIPSKPAGAPTLLKTTRGDGQVSLTWKAPASNGGSPVTDYAVESSTDGGKTWTRFADSVSVSPAAVVNGLVNGTAHVFRVAAVNSVGVGAWSAKTAPVVPAGLAGVPSELVATRGNAQVSLSWKAPASSGGLPITDYVIQSSVDGGTTWKVAAEKVSPATTATILGLANGTRYVFRVAAVNGVGTGPFTDKSVAVVPATLAGMPTGLVANRGDGEVSLVWKAPASGGGVAISDYTVQHSKDGGKTWTTVADGVSTNLGTAVKGLVNGTSYVFRVAAVNEVGTGPFTAKSAAVVPATNPGEPTQLAVTRSGTKATLTWKAPASTGGVAITDYAVEWSGDNGTTWKKLVRAPSSTTTAAVTGLSAAQSYRFRVATKNAAGLFSTYVEVISNAAA